MQKEFYTEKELAQKLGGLSCSTLQHWRWSGKGPKFIKIGARVLYPASEINNFLSQHPVVQSTSQYTFGEAK